MEQLSELSIKHFLERLSARQPIPGGGAVAALAGALAGALGQMVASYSVSSKTEPDRAEAIRTIGTRLGQCRAQMSAAIDADAQAYSDLSNAAPDAPNRLDLVRQAIAVPQSVVNQSVAVLELLDQLKDVSKAAMLSDLGAAAALAEAAARAAEYMIRVNAAELPNAEEADQLLSDTVETLAGATDKLAAIEEYLIDHI